MGNSFDRLIMEAERAADLVELLPDLRRLKSMPALIADSQTRVDRANRAHQEVLAKTEESQKALSGLTARIEAAKRELAEQQARLADEAAKAAAEREAHGNRVIAAAEEWAGRIVAEAQAKADELVREALVAVDDRRAEIAALNAEIERLGRDHQQASGKLAGVNAKLKELRQSL